MCAIGVAPDRSLFCLFDKPAPAAQQPVQVVFGLFFRAFGSTVGIQAVVR
jgi:hypothetical protein